MSNDIKHIPKNWDSGKSNYFGLSEREWAMAIAPNVFLAFFLNMVLPIFGVGTLISLIISAITAFLLSMICIATYMQGHNPYQVAIDIIAFLVRKRKLEYRYIKPHRKKTDEEIREEETAKKESSKKAKKETKSNKRKARNKKKKKKQNEVKQESKKNEKKKETPSQEKTSTAKSVFDDFVNEFSLPEFGKSNYYVQESVPVESIVCEKGMYLLKMKNGNYTRILEIESIDYAAEDFRTKEEVAEGFLKFLKAYAGSTVQIKIITEPPDMTSYNERLTEKAAQDTSPYIRELTASLTEFFEMQSRDLKLNRYFLITEVGGENAFYLLGEFGRCARSHLEKGGVRIRYHQDEKAFLEDVVYNHYNHPDINAHIGNREFRENKVKELTRRGGVYTEPKLHHILSPLGMDFTASDVVYASGLYHQTVYLTNFPRDLYVGWLRYFINSCSTMVDIDLFIQKQNRGAIQSFKLGAKLSDYVATSPRGQSPELEEVIYDTNYIKNNMATSDLYYFTMSINIHAPKIDDIEELKKYLKDNVLSFDSNMKIESGKYSQEGMYLASAPFCKIDQTAFKRFHRNVLDDGMLSLVPFMTTSTTQTEGVVFGQNRSDGSPIMVDLFNPRPAHTIVIGGTGGGKTFSTMMQMTRSRLDGTQVIVVCPCKGHEYKILAEGDKYCSGLDGQYIPLGPGHKTRINVMAITPSDNATLNENEGEEGEEEEEVDERFVEKSFLEMKIADLETFFKLAFPELTPQQRDQLSTALRKLYNNFGITSENSSVYNEDGTLKKMPLIEDFQKVMEEDSILCTLAPQLNKFVSGSLSFFNADTNISLNNKFTVIDLTAALSTKKDDMALLINLATTLINSRVKTHTDQRKLVIFEEAWMFKSQPEIFAVIEDFFRTSRSYNAACFCISQAMSDFVDAKGVLGCCQNYILFGNKSESDAKLCVDHIPALNDSDVETLFKLKIGEAILIREDKRVVTKFEACEEEKYLYETAPEKRKQRFDARRKMSQLYRL